MRIPDPSDRMQVRAVGELQQPASCLICGTGNCDEGYLDLAVFIDYVGTAYLCKTCLYEGAETFGMFTPDEVASQQKLLDELNKANAELQEQLDAALKHVDSANTLLHSAFLPSYLPTGTEQPPTEPVLTIAENVTEGSVSGESIFTEPTPIRRRTDSRRS